MTSKKQEITVKEILKPYILKDGEICIETITTRYDLNWYYLRTKILSLNNSFKFVWLCYANWFNFTFNRKEYIKKLVEDIYFKPENYGADE